SGHLRRLAKALAATGRRSLHVVQVVERVLAAERVVDGDAAREVAGPAADAHRGGHDVHSEHGCAAGGRWERAEQGADGCRLAGPVRPKEAEDLARLDLQVEG